MIGEMKREALQSLNGKWGLGVGSTILYFILNYILSFVVSFIILIPGIFLMAIIGSSISSFEEETATVGAVIAIIVIYGLMFIVNLASYGIMTYGYMNLSLRLSKRDGAVIDCLFEGFRGFKRMLKAMKAMLAICLYTGTWIPVILIGMFVFLFGEGSDSANESLGIAFFVLLFISFIVIVIASLSYAMTYYILVENPEYGVLQALKESKAMMKGHKMDLFLLGLSFIGWAVLAIFTFGIGFLWLYPYFNTTIAHFYQYVSENKSN